MRHIFFIAPSQTLMLIYYACRCLRPSSFLYALHACRAEGQPKADENKSSSASLGVRPESDGSGDTPPAPGGNGAGDELGPAKKGLVPWSSLGPRAPSNVRGFNFYWHIRGPHARVRFCLGNMVSTLFSRQILFGWCVFPTSIVGVCVYCRAPCMIVSGTCHSHNA